MEHAVDPYSKTVQESETKHRRVRTAIPEPEPAPILKKPHDLEPRAPHGRPPVVWGHAGGFQECDNAGSRWIDWSGGGRLLASTGTGRRNPKICPPSMINEEALNESLDPLEEMFEEALAAGQREEVTA